MQKLSRTVYAVLFALALTTTGLVAATPAKAAPGGCLLGVGKKVPVLFVHGLLGKPKQWGEPGDPNSIRGRVEKIPNVVTDAFSYAPYSTQWVTDPHISKALAERITCMAESSRQQGGAGKVIVVAHSMGGLWPRARP